MTQKDSDRAWVRQLGLFGVIVSEVVASVGVGAVLGYLIRKYLHIGTWVIGITVMAGFGLAMIRIYKMTQKELK